MCWQGYVPQSPSLSFGPYKYRSNEDVPLGAAESREQEEEMQRESTIAMQKENSHPPL